MPYHLLSVRGSRRKKERQKSPTQLIIDLSYPIAGCRATQNQRSRLDLPQPDILNILTSSPTCLSSTCQSNELVSTLSLLVFRVLGADDVNVAFPSHALQSQVKKKVSKEEVPFLRSNEFQRERKAELVDARRMEGDIGRQAHRETTVVSRSLLLTKEILRRTLQPSHSFLTLLRTFIPLHWPPDTAHIGLLVKMPIVRPMPRHNEVGSDVDRCRCGIAIEGSFETGRDKGP